MDDQQTYLLNGLLSRQYDLGRILRFRQVPRGREATTYELLTAEHHEYVVYLYPPAYETERLEFVAGIINTLDENRFTVVPMLRSKTGEFTTEGPQGAAMLVSINVAGSALGADQYTHHDISQVGLRLAWMHRLLREQVTVPAGFVPLATRIESALADPATASLSLSAKGREMLAAVVNLLKLPLPAEARQGWCHGDIQLGALLHDSDHQLRTVVDWGLLHYGIPLEDLIDAFTALCLDPQGALNLQRGRALIEAYDSLLPLKGIPWTPLVATWCTQRFLDASASRRPLPKGFGNHITAPERLAMLMASCV